MPRGQALIILVLICATVGAGLAGSTLEGRRSRLLGVIGALVAAQLLGHIALTLATTHHHGGIVEATPSMTAAHLAAAVALGVTITSVEYLYVVCTSVLCWLQLFFTAAQRPTPRSLRMESADVVAPSGLRCSGFGMRAPPRCAPSPA